MLSGKTVSALFDKVIASVEVSEPQPVSARTRNNGKKVKKAKKNRIDTRHELPERGAKAPGGKSMVFL